MFDDLFCAVALAAVAAVVAAGVYTGASEFSGATPVQAVASKGLVSADGKRSASVARDAMPIYDLPRVVVTGNRSRDGDQMAAELTAEPGRSGER